MPNRTLTVTQAIVVDTFREAFARKIFWGLFALSTLMIAFFLFIMKIDIMQGATATISLFGNRADANVDADMMVRKVQAGVAAFLYTWGMFLAVFASAGLIPSVLEPGRIELLLSKPVSRAHLLLGRYLGNVLVVGGNIAYLVCGIWLILGIKTGIWTPAFLIAIVTTMFLFAVLLSVVVLIGVLLESTALAVMVPTGLMLISPVLAQVEMMDRLLSSEWSRALWRTLYHCLPKVYDIGRLTMDIVLGTKIQTLTPIATTAAVGAAILALSIHIFRRRDF
ncbi:MAG: ABC transporter permease subunit [Acidobacteria bacterium]|nr:ABC transporter permease subunit [Acidobacteriota bacterium]